MTETLNIPMNLIISKLAVTLSLTIFGYLAGKFKLITEEGYSSISNLLVFITMPALLFSATIAGISKESLLTLSFAPILGFINIAIMLSISLLIAHLVKMPSEKIGTFGALCSIPNSSYLGYPLILFVLGERGLTYAVAYDTGVCIALWTLVIAVLKGGTHWRVNWRQILNPALIAVLLALTINLSGLRLPTIAIEPLQIMGQASVPLAMTVIGYRFFQMKFTFTHKFGYLLITALVKLVIYPLVAYIFLGFFDLDPAFKLVVFMIAAMPSMSTAPVIAEKFGGDVDFATSGMFLTTILSMVTIPLLLYILG